MSEPLDDMSALVDAARGGDRGAFDELVRRTHAGTYTLALRLTANEEDARDVTQEAYLRAFRGLKNYRGDAQFTTWLYRITANCASTFLNTRSRHRHEELGDGAEAAPNGVARRARRPRRRQAPWRAGAARRTWR